MTRILKYQPVSAGYDADDARAVRALVTEAMVFDAVQKHHTNADGYPTASINYGGGAVSLTRQLSGDIP